MKVAISIPNPIFERAERIRARTGSSRSQLYAKAVAAFVADHEADDIRERLDAVYADVDSSMDPILAELQAEALHEDW